MFIWHIGQTVTSRSASRRSARVDQATDQLEPGVRADLGHVPAATGGPQREVDDLGAQRGHQPVELARLLALRPAIVVVGSRHEAAQVRRDAQPVERPGDVALDLVETDVLDEHLEQVADGDRAGRVAEAVGGQRVVELVAQGRALAHEAVRLGQVGVAGAARRDERARAVALALGEREVAPDQRVAAERAEGQVLGRAAAVPVVDLASARCRAGRGSPSATRRRLARCPGSEQPG